MAMEGVDPHYQMQFVISWTLVWVMVALLLCSDDIGAYSTAQANYLDRFGHNYF